MEFNEKQKLAYLEGWISVVLNTALFGVKYWVGVMCGSISMIADAWHTLSDTLTSLVVIVAFWFAGKKPDSNHPFGHGRAELIAALIVGTLLGVVGFEFLLQSIHRLIDYQSATFGWFAVTVFIGSTILKEALAQFSFWAGRKTNSGSLTADGWHHRSDAIASALIVVGALAGVQLWWIDGVMGIAVAFLILYAAVDIFRHATNTLLGEVPAPELETKINQIMRNYAPQTSDPHHFHIHRYGDHIELTFHVRVPSNMSLSEAHTETTTIEKALREELKLEATIHSEPGRSP